MVVTNHIHHLNYCQIFKNILQISKILQIITRLMLFCTSQIKSESVRIALPEDGEDLDTKVKRHRQVMQSEVDDAAGQKISRFVYNAFKDGGATGYGADNNPLLRRNKLSSTNPLL